MQFSHAKVEFNRLPYEAQLSRLSALATRALAHYGLDNATVTLANYTNNAVFRVESAQGTFALRIHRAGLKPLAWLKSELMWLSALTEKGMCVPSPAGDIYAGQLDDEPLTVYCTLTNWLIGEHLTFTDMTNDHFMAIGRFIGTLHNIASTFTASAEFVRPQLDYEGLFGEKSPYNPKDGVTIFTDEQKQVMMAVQARVASLFDQLGRTSETVGLIHADLIPKNLVWDGDRVGAIDFDDCGYGYFLYDLAPMLWMNRNEPNYAQLRLMIWDGYRQIRPQPEHWLNALPTLVGRHVMSLLVGG